MPFRDHPGSVVTVSGIRANQNPDHIALKSKASQKSGNINHGASTHIANNDNVGDDFDSRLPHPGEPSGVYNILMTDSDLALTKRKFVKVSSIGEVEVSPDKIEFCIQIFSTKVEMSAAKESIKKRYDFLMLALKKLGVHPDGISQTSIVKKYKLEDDIEEDDDLLEMKILRDVEKQLAREKKDKVVPPDPLLQKEKVKVVKEIYVVCDSLNQYMELFSIVNEKLDRQVNVSPPIIRITPENLQMQNQAAAKLAMDNAIDKATQLLHSQKNLKAAVGKLFYSVEDSLSVTDIAEYHNINTSTAFETLKWKRNNKLVRCKLTCLFEVNTVKANRR